MKNQPTIPPGYKPSPLGPIPEDWEVETIGELAKIKHGRDQKLVLVKNGIYPILASGGEIGRTNTALYSSPSVLIGRKGTIDKPKYIETPFWTVDTLFYTEIFERTIPKWLFYKFETINWYLYNEASGVPSLSSSTISSIKVIVPPLPEQKTIANLLSTWDAAIQTTTQLIAAKEQRKKHLMQNLLTGKERLKGFEGEWKPIILKSMINEYIESRDHTSIYEVLTSAKAGLIRQKEYFGNNRITERDDSGFNVIPPGYITYRSRSDDGIFSFNKNNLGIIGLISGYYPVFTIINGDINFFLYWTVHYNKEFKKFSVGTSQLVLSLNELKKVKFIMPSPIEQTAIAAVLQTADKEIQLLKAKLDKLKEQKKGLMQQLLTGKKRLKLEK